MLAMNPAKYESLPEDALPASLRIDLVDANDAEEVAARVEGAPGVDEVRFGGEAREADHDKPAALVPAVSGRRLRLHAIRRARCR